MASQLHHTTHATMAHLDIKLPMQDQGCVEVPQTSTKQGAGGAGSMLVPLMLPEAVIRLSPAGPLRLQLGQDVLDQRRFQQQQ